jgi:hypothetical protein
MAAGGAAAMDEMAVVDEMNIWIAASDGNLDFVRQSIEEAGLRADAKDDNGYTPLYARSGVDGGWAGQVG